MSYQVIVQESAFADLRAILRRYERNSDDAMTATRFYEDWLRVIESLTLLPESHSRAQEDQGNPITVRNAMVGVGPKKTHRAIFVVIDNRVRIARVVHMRHDLLSFDDLMLS